MKIILITTLLIGLVASQEDEELTPPYQGAGWWMKQPYTSDDEFNVKAEYTSNYTFEVNMTAHGLVTVEYWVIPNLRIMEDGDRVTFKTLDGISSWEVENDGKNMVITLVQEAHFGFYHVHGNDTDGNWKAVKLALNYQGPFFGDLWEVYRMNTIVGCSSAAAFLLITAVTYLIYEWKFVDDQDTTSGANDESSTKYQPEPKAEDNSFTNMGYMSEKSGYDQESDVIKTQPNGEGIHSEMTTEL